MMLGTWPAALMLQAERADLPPVDLGATVQRVLVVSLLILLAGWAIQRWVKVRQGVKEPLGLMAMLGKGTRPELSAGVEGERIAIVQRHGLRPGVEFVAVQWKGNEYLLGVHPDRMEVIDQVSSDAETLP